MGLSYEPANATSYLDICRFGVLVHGRQPVAKTVKEESVKDQPNLQAILNTLYEQARQDGENSKYNDYLRTPEAIDVIYAGLLAEVIEPGIFIDPAKTAGEVVQDLRDNQTKLLKRWCYGNKEQQL